MGWKTYTIFCTDQPGYFEQRPIHDPVRAEKLLSILGLNEYDLVKPHTQVNDYPSSGDLYIGAYERGLVIANTTLAALLFDDNSRTKNFGRVKDNPDFRKNIHTLYPNGEVIALILHSVVNMWGYSVYQRGELIRSASGAEGEFYGSIGDPLPEEQAVLAEHPIELIDKGDVIYSEDLVFDVSQRVLGCRYDEASVDELECSYFKRRSFLKNLFR
jgi:hypothetical protein